MKKLLRYLIGGKVTAPPPIQTRVEPAHELAMKAVVRRRKENARIEAKGSASGVSSSPVVSEQAAPARQAVIRRNGEEVPFSPPREALRKQADTTANSARVSPEGAIHRTTHQLADLAMYTREPRKPGPEPTPRTRHQLADIGGALE